MRKTSFGFKNSSPSPTKSSSSSSSSRRRDSSIQASIHAQVFATNNKSKSEQALVDEVKKCALITAIKTPYLKSGKIDLQKYDVLVEQQILGGVQGLVVGGTTGEGQLMSWDEHIMLIAHTSKIYGEDLLVIGNTGSNSTRKPTRDFARVRRRDGRRVADKPVLREDQSSWVDEAFRGGFRFRADDRV